MRLIDLIHKLLAEAQSRPEIQHHEVVETRIVTMDPSNDSITYTLEVN